MRPSLREELTVGFAPLWGKLPPIRVVLFAQGRTGSTLLGELIGSHPDVVWADEILQHPVRWPMRWVRGQARRCDRRAFGFHVKIYQLWTIQRVSDPGAFVRRLHQDGWSVFHLWRRDVVRHVLSNLAAEERGSFHDRDGTAQRVRFQVDTDELLRRCAKRDAQHQKELDALVGLPYETFCYEDDLLDVSRWQVTANKAFSLLGLQAQPVKTTLTRLNTGSLEDMVSNVDEVRAALAGTPYERFVSQPT